MEFVNKIFNDDILNVLQKLPDKSVDMIYSDPDYNVGIKYNGKSYKKKFDEYIDWYINLAKESFRVLKDNGNMFFINYPKQNAYLRVKYLDEVCYEVLDYVWIYNTNIGHSPKRFTTAHRSILHCRKTKNNKWFKNQVAEPYKNPNDKRIQERIKKGNIGRMPYSWMYYDLVKNVSKEKTFHSCQIPIKLFEKLLLASTQENDIVLIHFGGSGNEILKTMELKRNFISAEIDKKYYEMIVERIKNFEILPSFKFKLLKPKQTSLFNIQ
jgi:DNA modification methylase